MVTNTKENGFETLIVDYLVKNNGYEQGENKEYNRDYAIDETRLFRFLQDTQPDKLEKLGVQNEMNKIKKTVQYTSSRPSHQLLNINS